MLVAFGRGPQTLKAGNSASKGGDSRLLGGELGAGVTRDEGLGAVWLINHTPCLSLPRPSPPLPRSHSHRGVTSLLAGVH